VMHAFRKSIAIFWILGFAEMGKKGRFLLPIYRILHKYALMTDD